MVYRGDDAPPPDAAEHDRRRRRRAADRRERRALPCAGTAAAAGRRDLHPRACDHRDRRPAARSQRRAASEIAAGDGAAVPQGAGGDCGDAEFPEPLQLLARGVAQDRISGRNPPGFRHAAGCTGRAGEGRRAAPLSERDAGAKVREALDKELAITAELKYAPYFLTVHDIVRFARSKGILCQGRGSAANSVICYCLGITEVDPEKVDLLFERFVSAERREPPDIDVDFEHERREEVIQYIYNRYGRERAGLGRHRHLLPRPQRDPRGRQGLRPVRRHHRRARQHAVGLVDGRRHAEGSAARRARSDRSAARSRSWRWRRS